MLRRAIGKLLSNAVRHALPGGPVTIGVAGSATAEAVVSQRLRMPQRATRHGVVSLIEPPRGAAERIVARAFPQR
ncbi:hypothetical protein [Accumulibacter sp.]|uniref:hypothetical protein n=1 Tax=Accumulibacter sp. TaxID=2053492 RepID=UPI0025D7885D|nr:hypothetical protein [Accumulibacter sp.]MCM8611356.1 hypothetical protein [Accumulibacter sp.]MCM8634997.1 hypothetical protein [Accumulibacter sp.]MCM8639785.1 hypothetical protein [Accumulibacter sp.]